MNVSAISQRLTPQMVPSAAARAADTDGDGRTGAVALNDGDAAAHGAARQVISQPGAPAPTAHAPAQHAPAPHKVDVKA